MQILLQIFKISGVQNQFDIEGASTGTQTSEDLGQTVLWPHNCT